MTSAPVGHGARAAVGVDVGGRSVRAALVDGTGAILFEVARPTPVRTRDPEAVLSVIVEVGRAAEQAARTADVSVAGFGFGVPTYVLGEDWLLTNCHNVPSLEGMELRPPLAATFGESIACDMDTNAATMGEVYLGRAKGCRRAVVAILGTGISFGVAIDQRLLRYTSGTAGDLGHLVVDESSPVRCMCGGRGCLEALASAGGIERRALDMLRDSGPGASVLRLGREGPTFSDIVQAARGGDDLAAGVLREAGRHLGVALASTINVFSPRLILVGGGVAEAGELLLRDARRTARQLASPYHLSTLVAIEQCGLRSKAGVVGAASMMLFGQA